MMTTKPDENNTQEKKPVFSFQRMGGLDQVVLKNDEEWQCLDKLDPKLWMALSCPVQGLEFSHETMDLLDADHNGRIRAQEVKEAVAWLCERLAHPEKLREAPQTITLESLRDDTEAGKALALAGAMVLEKHGKPSDAQISLEEIEDVLTVASGYPFNGDGIVPPDSVPDAQNSSLADMRNYITKALAIIGGKKDASGKPGLDADLNTALVSTLKSVREWRQSLKKANLPLGEKTGEGWSLLQRLGPKLDDFFSRCNLASFAPDILAKITAGPQNVDETPSSTATLINPDTLLELPLAKINPDGVLDTQKGINPAWAQDMAIFAELMAPLSGSSTIKKLDEKQWRTICDKFADYATILDKRPVFPVPDADAGHVDNPGLPELALAPADDSLQRAFLPLNPGEVIAALSDEELEVMLGDFAQQEFAGLVARDLAAPPLASFQDLRKLALYQANIYTFLRNFLSFMDFYDPEKKAIFQVGVLYLDSRSCVLCVPVDDVDNHARLAAQSHLCLIYCDCARKNADGSEQHCTIAAALTAGNLAALIDGRHGLFIDNDGNEWDTKIIRVIHNPISLREAWWAPYIRIGNMIGEQIQKFVSAKDKAVSELTGKAAGSITSMAKKEAPKEGFDFAKNAGIFAALSVALSVLSAAFAYIANSVASLGWWWPLAIVGLFLCISGPSVIIAWFKLRKRSLGPLLDASGWAVNQGAPINLVMGASLTSIGKLPPNSIRNLNDPYGMQAIIRAKKRKAWFWTIIVLLVLAAIGGFWLYCVLWGEPVWLFKIRALGGF